jgi:hypothetical protein
MTYGFFNDGWKFRYSFMYHHIPDLCNILGLGGSQFFNQREAEEVFAVTYETFADLHPTLNGEEKRLGEFPVNKDRTP